MQQLSREAGRFGQCRCKPDLARNEGRQRIALPLLMPTATCLMVVIAYATSERFLLRPLFRRWQQPRTERPRRERLPLGA